MRPMVTEQWAPATLQSTVSYNVVIHHQGRIACILSLDGMITWAWGQDAGNGLLDEECLVKIVRAGNWGKGRRSGSCISRMEQDTTQEKQVGDQSQAPLNGEEAEPKGPKPDDARKLIQFMETHYDKFVSGVQSFDEFYHAIFELIEMFCEERGQFQYKIPERKTLLDAYEAKLFVLPENLALPPTLSDLKHHKSQGELKKEEFVAITRDVVGVNSFTFGKAAAEFAMFLFGAPLCAVVAKRILPGLGWLSDDVVIPLATSGSVAYLIKTKRL
ncbi:hypothetical protein EJB05_18762, partial [Eragrostis curvula]